MRIFSDFLASRKGKRGCKALVQGKKKKSMLMTVTIYEYNLCVCAVVLAQVKSFAVYYLAFTGKNTSERPRERKYSVAVLSATLLNP